MFTLVGIKLNLVRRRFNLSDVSKAELLCKSDKVARYALGCTVTTEVPSNTLRYFATSRY